MLMESRYTRWHFMVLTFICGCCLSQISADHRDTTDDKTTPVESVGSADHPVIEREDDLTESPHPNKQQILDQLPEYCSFIDSEDVAFSGETIVILMHNDILGITNSHRDRCFKDLFQKHLATWLSSLNFIVDSSLLDNALEPCTNLIKKGNVGEFHIDLSQDKFYWYLKYYACAHCNDIANIYNVCQENLYIIQDNLLNFQSNASFNDSFVEVKFLLMPTVPWSCPRGKHFYRASETLFILHQIDNRLPQDCGEWICSDPIKFHPFNYYVFRINKSKNYSKCQRHAYRNSSFEGMELFSFKFFSSTVMFITSDDNGTVDSMDIMIPILLHFVRDSQHKKCCAYGFDLIEEKDYHLYFCYGDPESCKLQTEFLFIAKYYDNNYLILINNGTDPNIISSNNIFNQSLESGIALSPSHHHFLFSHLKPQFLSSSKTYIPSYFYEYLKKFDVYYAPIHSKDKEELKIILRELEAYEWAYDICEENEYFITCSTRSIVETATVWIFLHNCSLTYPTEDKMKLILYALNDPEKWFDLEYICRSTTSVVQTSVDMNLIPVSKTRSYVRPKDNCRDFGIGVSHTKCKPRPSGWTSRFYHFCLYPKDLSKESAVKLLTSQRNSILQTEKKFGIAAFIGITKLEENENNQSIQNDEEEISAESVKNTIRIFVIAALTNNTQCLEDLSEQRFSIKANVSPNLQYLIGPISSNVAQADCLSILPSDIYDSLRRSNESQSLTVNKFWPICLNNMLVAWREWNTTFVAQEYDYLSCKIGETALFVFMCTVTMITIVGNMLVLLVLICSDLYKKKSFMIHTNLSIADLLLGITSSMLAVYETYCLRTGSLTIHDLDKNGTFANFDLLTSHQNQAFQQLRFERKEAFPVISSIVMNISVSVSLLLVALLSIQRLKMIEGKPLKGNHLSFAICVIWISSIFLSILVNYREEGWLFVGYMDPITKITINIGTGKGSTSSSITYIQMVVGGAAGITVVVTTIYSIFVFRLNERRTQQLQMGILDQLRKEKMKAITRHLSLMVALFLLSSMVIVIDLWLDFANKKPIWHFVLWWLFMAGASWNWIIYCLLGQYFRSEAKKVVQKAFKPLGFCITILREAQRSQPSQHTISLEMSKVGE